MKALLSGQAGVAVILGEQPQFRPVEGEAYVGTQGDIAMTFAGFPDVETVEVDSVSLLDRQLGRSFAVDRAKFLLFMLLDGEQDEETRREIAEEIERLVSRYRVKGEVTSQLSGVSPDEGGLEKAQVLAAEYDGIASLLAAMYPGVEAAKDRVLVQFDSVADRASPFVGTRWEAVQPQRVTGLLLNRVSAKGAKSYRPVLTTTTTYPEKFRKVVDEIVLQARASLASSHGKHRRGLPTRLGYVDSRELEKAVDKARRRIAAELRGAGLDLAPPPRAELTAMIRISRHNTREHKIGGRKHGRRVAHA